MSRLSIVSALACMLATVSAAATGETPLPSGLAIELLPGYTHQPKQILAAPKFVKMDGVTITYTIGGVVPPGGLRTGDSYTNMAKEMSADDRQWFKDLRVGGREFSVAYGKNKALIVSTQFDKVGINFGATAETPEEVADVLLTALTIVEKPQKK